jgi:hypothetical protein
MEQAGNGIETPEETRMARTLPEIVAHLRACIADGSIKTTLIQTEDLALLCDAAVGPEELLGLVDDALNPRQGWKVQPFSYYAAHFLVGAGLTGGDLYGNMKGLAAALKNQYEIGVEHGKKLTDDSATPVTAAQG